jgi:hypothetical protein
MEKCASIPINFETITYNIIILKNLKWKKYMIP